ncbi:MAG: tyrosine-protein kinase [Mycobacterium sp.]|jgi:capsular polysaccharide biosynthesis protein|nr:tyrosine-protein kinase [Mycobacterium sp.]
MTGMVALLAIVRNRFLLLITCALLGAAAGGGINTLLPVTYEATAKILIATPYWNDNTAIADPNFGGDKTFWWDKTMAVGDEFTGQRLPSYARLVTTPLVTEPVAERMGFGEDAGGDLAKKLRGHVVPETMLLEVSAQDVSPVRAASIADAAARQTISVIKAVERPPHVVVSPVQPVLTVPAAVPSRPISPRTLQNIGCGAIIGFLVGLTYVAAYVGTRESRRLARFRGDGAPRAELGGVLGVLMAEDDLPVGEVNNDARLLRLEVDHRLTQAGVQSLVMTSPLATPATLNAAALLATALAEAGSRTVVVCADFAADRHSTVGLSDLLAARLTLDSVILTDERRGISWIPAGTAPTNRARLLAGSKMRDLLIELSGRYRHVIVVCPPPLDEADVVDMASQVGASILVDFVPQTAAEERRESDSERLLRLALGSYLGRVVVNGPAFSQPVEMPPFDRQHPAGLVRSNTANGE